MLVTAFVSLIYAAWLRKGVLAERQRHRKDAAGMERHPDWRRQLSATSTAHYIALIVLLTVALFFSVYIVPPSVEATF